VSFGQVIRHPDNLQELVVSILSVPVTVFDKLWKSGNEQKLFYVRASDSIGHVIYTNVEKNEPAELQPSPDQPFIQAIIRPYGIVLEASVLDKYLVRPYLASIVQINLILIIFTIICITLFVMYAIYKIKPIYTLARKMSKAKQGDFVVQMSYKSPDELGMLTRTFNEMTVEINRLFRAKEQEYNEKLTILRLSLETRINPHFIYNMLDFIQYQVGEKDAETVSDMIISLSHILRYTIDNPGEPVLLETEMRWLNDYLHLQKQLHGGEVDIVIDATEETQECIVDKLILQPLIENCFVHGFEDRSRIYRLEIHIELSEDNLIITLRDNGKGFAASMDLVLDRNHCELFPQAGVGLSVTLQRFLLTHDNRTIKIKSTPGHGTEITLIQTACKNV
jgi:two-component system sensor histidine kinase YesM